ncbi:hypothetical protein C8F01DRAFT_1098729 [Mycena amicta]|nr:hypothetical protein C8F01DRAFT_1098729 [Mycena amicta]
MRAPGVFLVAVFPTFAALPDVRERIGWPWPPRSHPLGAVIHSNPSNFQRFSADACNVVVVFRWNASAEAKVWVHV